MGCSNMRIGFSTGSLALDDVRRGLRMATHQRVKAIELSALREQELDPLLGSLDSLEEELRPFEHIALHAPSRLERMTEEQVVTRLKKVATRGWAIIVHPDVIHDYQLWRQLARAVCLENMDKRKRTGRTARELAHYFAEIPDATFCFDIGHARQIDPTMGEAAEFLRCFSDRLRQIHMSYVNSQSRHERLNFESLTAFRRVAHRIDDRVPVILETPVAEEAIEAEVSAAESVFANGGAARPPDREREVAIELSPMETRQIVGSIVRRSTAGPSPVIE